ncbi:sensor histidine kinase [Deinococcus koreensis]|uniref:histidine kinase n=1 Tax=Deinococcus koreensis TaxID=2054903 RepID=A0A2K3V2H0_9DEIO|nr:HAMP domain-containing sensor histidine kinase [Deinococcus koreensis]PNY82971.1 sensor histidine kinase [Deinococcus koreensis]
MRGVPPALAWREALLAALPALLTIALLSLATQPAYRALINGNNGARLYAFQGLVQDVQSYQIASLSPEISPRKRLEFHDRALSSARTPTQFTGLAEIESYGEARLAQVAHYLEQDTPESRAAASLEAIRLGRQADEQAKAVIRRYVGALTQLRRTLLGTALVTGLMSMLLIARALLMWRAERERRSRREARQREALHLASHELRRPLQSLLLASDLLRHADTPERRQHLLGLIEDSAAQLASRADLTRLNDLYLDVTLRVSSTDLRPLLRRLASARVQVEVPSQPVTWLVDPDRLLQIVENLVENALKYTDGLVEVRLQEVGGAPEISVRDRGPGLSESQLETVFLPYERGPRGLRGGQGLGLPLVRRYARAHGGDVSLAPAPGGGLIATVRLGEPASSLTEPRRPTLFE